ncbi:CN hydrolase domain-containing protein [Fusarium keratoplasticum]|nr:CN hydrolase domain-containing protein [Fusarium keratoplasticum]
MDAYLIRLQNAYSPQFLIKARHSLSFVWRHTPGYHRLERIIVVLGFSESRHGSLYISQAIIGADGQTLTLRSKIKATHMERTIFGDATAECLDSVVDTPFGRIGALSCWEHVQLLLKYHTYSQREQIHIAAWPPVFGHDGKSLWSMSREGTEAIARTYAIES